jgi:hypothetical protein
MHQHISSILSLISVGPDLNAGDQFFGPFFKMGKLQFAYVNPIFSDNNFFSYFISLHIQIYLAACAHEVLPVYILGVLGNPFIQ